MRRQRLVATWPRDSSSQAVLFCSFTCALLLPALAVTSPAGMNTYSPSFHHSTAHLIRSPAMPIWGAVPIWGLQAHAPDAAPRRPCLAFMSSSPRTLAYQCWVAW